MGTETTTDRFVLAIDMGTGSAKVALVSESGQVVASAIRTTRMQLLPGGGAEQDPNDWWAAVREAARVAIAQSGVPKERIVAAACTTQWAVTTPVDERGEAIGNAISWLDTRGGPYSREVARGFPSVDGYGVAKALRWVQLTAGAPVASGQDGLGHVLFLKHERPDVYRRAYKLLEPMDYLNLRLTGKFAASYGTMFPYWLADNRDPNHVTYSETLLRITGVDREKLPDLFPVNHVLGTVKPDVAAELGLSPETRVLMGSGDGHSACIGAGAIRDFDGYFYIGTSSWISCHIPRRKTDPIHRLSSMPAALAGRYVVTAEQGMAGRCFEFARDLLYPANTSVDPYLDMNELAEKVPPGSDDLVFLPWIGGVLTPIEEPRVRSAFINQSAHTTRGHYARAVMEGVAYNLRWLKGYVEKFIGHRFDRLAFIGGGATSNLWCQIQADVLGVPIRQVAQPRNANAVGCAMAAFVALGIVKVEDIESRIRIAHVYEPVAANQRTYDRLYEEFLASLKALKPIYRRLNAQRHA